MRAALAMACVVGVSPACAKPEAEASDRASRYRLDFAAVSDRGFSGRGQQGWVRDVAAGGLASSRWFRAEGGEPSLSARLTYQEATLATGESVLWVEFTVEPDVELADRLAAADLELDAVVELIRKDGPIDLRRDLPSAVTEAVTVLDAKVSMVRGPSTELATLLDSPEPEVIKLGLSEIARRRRRDLGDRVAALVSHEDESVAMLAVECLGVIGGPQHAARLVRDVPLADRAYANRLYEALANLGGAQARGFLEFAARNEEDPELATLAERALERLDAGVTRAPRPTALPSIGRGHRQ